MSVYTIEGNIGSGKSILLEMISKYQNIIPIDEPVNVWKSIMDVEGMNMIEKFYANQKKYAFSFQMMAYISRLHLLKKALRENPDGIFISERSIYTDRYVFAKMLYDDKKIEKVNYEIYLKWFDEFAQEFPMKGIIYLQTSPNVCHKRIKLRARKGEENISLEYVKRCHTFHEEWINNDTTTLFLNGDTTTPKDHLNQIKIFTCNHKWVDISTFDVQNHCREYKCEKCEFIRN
jgi:deoxyadenosine/deoxycytidine kinase